jgi:hypothetical protein
MILKKDLSALKVKKQTLKLISTQDTSKIKSFLLMPMLE